MIWFVGAGPGAPDLITLRGRDRLAAADVVVWASSLVPDALLEHARPAAEVNDSAGMTLEDVLGVYAAHPDARIDSTETPFARFLRLDVVRFRHRLFSGEWSGEREYDA